MLSAAILLGSLRVNLGVLIHSFKIQLFSSNVLDSQQCFRGLNPRVQKKKKIMATKLKDKDFIQATVELHWLKHSWDHENWFQSKVVPASQGKFL